MFLKLDSPRFEILEVTTGQDHAHFLWRFTYSVRNDEVEGFEGMSRVRFDPLGQVLCHEDYWDPSTPVYRRVPLLGVLVALVQRRLRSK